MKQNGEESGYFSSVFISFFISVFSGYFSSIFKPVFISVFISRKAVLKTIKFSHSVPNPKRQFATFSAMGATET